MARPGVVTWCLHGLEGMLENLFGKLHTKNDDGMVESIVRFSVLGMMNCLCSCLFLTFLTSLLCIIYMIQMLIQ